MESNGDQMEKEKKMEKRRSNGKAMIIHLTAALLKKHCIKMSQ